MHWLLLLATLAAPAPEKSGKELTLDMHERFAYAAMMRTALIHGFLERARRHAGQLAELLPETESEQLLTLARQAASATDIDQAALVVARAGESCGCCHEQNKVRPVFLAHLPAPPGRTLAARMGRHIWAADRMWEGLVSHSHESWRQGAEVLRAEPFFATTSAMGVPQARIDEISSIAADAASPHSWEKRAEIYGRFLAACSGCHQTYAH